MREDWVECKLGELSTYEIGGDWGKDITYEDDSYIEVYCIRGSEFRNWDKEKGKTSSLRKIKSDSYNKRKLLLNDIIVEISGGGPEQPVGRTVLIDKEALNHFKDKRLVFTNFLRLIRPSDRIISSYLNLYLKFFYSTGNIHDYQAGSNNLRNLKFDKYLSLEIPLPPLPEQRAIVKKIEALFSSLDAGISDLKKAQDQLKIYRQAVLKKAFEGELTKEWREKQTGLPSAEELLNEIKKLKINVKTKTNTLIEVDKSDLYEIPFGWIWDRLENLIFEVKDGTHDTPKYISEGIPFITQKNIKNNDISFDNVQFISLEDHKKFYERSNVAKNDIIMAMIGHNRGNCTIVKTEKVFSIKNVALFKFYNDQQLNKYFLYFFQYSGGLDIIMKKSKGGAQPFIGLTELRNWPIPYCSLEEQAQIVKEIEARLSVCDAVEQQIKDSLSQAEALRQSILKKAFEGRLLSEAEIKACQQEPDYEPASVLLEKIKAEKEANKPVKKTKKK